METEPNKQPQYVDEDGGVSEWISFVTRPGPHHEAPPPPETVASVPTPPAARSRTEPKLVLRGVRANEQGQYDTTVMLFQGRGDYLQGYVTVNGERRQVIAHINERKPDPETGALKPNFLTLSEGRFEGDRTVWRQIGTGNAMNKRSDGKPIYFDEVLFKVEGETLAARVAQKIDPDLHHKLGFVELRRERPKTQRTERPDDRHNPSATEGARTDHPSKTNPIAAAEHETVYPRFWNTRDALNQQLVPHGLHVQFEVSENFPGLDLYRLNGDPVFDVSNRTTWNSTGGPKRFSWETSAEEILSWYRQHKDDVTQQLGPQNAAEQQTAATANTYPLTANEGGIKRTNRSRNSSAPSM